MILADCVQNQESKEAAKVQQLAVEQLLATNKCDYFQKVNTKEDYFCEHVSCVQKKEVIHYP
jgi:hypothetical protein